MYNNDSKFTSVTIFVLASNETVLLRETIKEIHSNIDIADLEKIIVVLKSDVCPSYYEVNKLIGDGEFQKLEAYLQKAPNAVQCIAELPPLATSSHFIIMAADSEMDPRNVRDFVFEAKKKSQAIICAAKWLKESNVQGYGKIHELCSRVINTFISILFNKNVKDPFSLFQIYPTEVYRKMNFNSPKNFLYEYTLKPLNSGVEYKEIPTVYRKRTEGKSSFSIFILISVAVRFLITAVRIRFMPKR